MYGNYMGCGGGYYPGLGSSYMAPVETIITEEIYTTPSYGYGMGGMGYPMGGYGMGYGGMGCPVTYSTYY